MSRVKTILLVCTGNSCRSVMAAASLKKMLKGKGDYKIVTAGTAAMEGMQPTDQAIQVMSEQKCDISHHRSIALSDQMIEEADLILAMERRHQENILRRVPAASNKTYLLSEFGRIEKEHTLVDPDIPDPIGKPLDFYRRVSDIINESLMRTVKKLEQL